LLEQQISLNGARGRKEGNFLRREMGVSDVATLGYHVGGGSVVVLLDNDETAKQIFLLLLTLWAK